MSLEKSKVFERSVDSIQKIYAVVIALAVSQAIQSFLKDGSGGAVIRLDQISSGVPGLVAFFVTLVPFWHGMNRHLDRCYLEKPTGVVQGALLFDFCTFFIEAGFLFAAGWSLRSGISTFYYLGLLLGVDMLWAIISHQIHFPNRKSHAKRWSAINIVAMFVAFLVVMLPFQSKPWVLAVIALGRSIADYGLCWEFYFPSIEPQAAGQASAVVGKDAASAV